jgi:hypothetical protein
VFLANPLKNHSSSLADTQATNTYGSILKSHFNNTELSFAMAFVFQIGPTTFSTSVFNSEKYFSASCGVLKNNADLSHNLAISLEASTDLSLFITPNNCLLVNNSFCVSNTLCKDLFKSYMVESNQNQTNLFTACDLL